MPDGGGVRGLGAAFVAAAAAMFASHIGMPVWQVAAVAGLIGIGLAALVTGRWSGW